MCTPIALLGLCTGARLTGSLQPSIRDYLINSNVQLGATYDVGKKATSRYEQGYQAAARYINASREEIGMSHLVHYRPVNQMETPRPC